MFKSIKTKLIGLFILFGLIPFTTATFIAEMSAANSLSNQAFAQLESARDIKADSIQRYFATIDSQVKVMADNPFIQDYAERLTMAFQSFKDDDDLEWDAAKQQSLNQFYQQQFGTKFTAENEGTSAPVDEWQNQLSDTTKLLQYSFISNNTHPLGEKNSLTVMPDSESTYAMLHEDVHTYLNNFLQSYGYYDVFIVSNAGDVVYSVYKEVDYATSLTDGPFAKSGLADAFNAAKELEAGQSVLIDFQTYSPSYNAPASFIATPIIKNGHQKGVLIYQMPIDRINAIMQQRSGMGETGETYLVGSDKLMRSDSYLDPKHHSMIASFKNPAKGSVDTHAMEEVLEGKTGSEIILDYNNASVLSAYTPINILSLNWAVVAEIDEAEAFAPIQSLINSLLIIALISTLLIIAIGFWVAKRMSQPIIQLEQGLRNVQQTGTFTARINHSSDDEIGQAAVAFNSLMTTLQTSFKDISAVMQAVSQGDFNKRITDDYQGDIEALKIAVNGSAQSVDNTMHELEVVMDAMQQGDFAVRMSNDIEGELKVKVDSAMQSLQQTIESISEVMAQSAQGNFSKRVTVECHGELDNLKTSVNESISAIDVAFIEINQVADKLQQGDLTTLVNGEYAGQIASLQQALNGSITQLNNMISEISSNTNDFDISVNELNMGNQDLNNRTQNQAASLEETAASMEELTSTISANTENAQQASEIAILAREEAQSSVQVLHDTNDAMTEIKNSSEEIENIVGLIDSIAFQTNLLALNAAVEAARAGEQGRGFAVVAGEVRSLAQKSAEAAKDIKGLIDKSRVQVDKGAELANRSSETFTSINAQISQVSERVVEIAAASKDQAKGVEQVSEAVQSMDQITQQNAALVEEATSLTESIRDKSQNLNRLAQGFKVTNRGLISK